MDTEYPVVGTGAMPRMSQRSMIERLRLRTGWVWNEGSRRWSVGCSVALVFGATYVAGVLRSDALGPTKTASTVLMVIMLVCYIVLPAGLFSSPMWVRWATLSVITALAVPQLFLMGVDGVGVLIFPTIMTAALLSFTSTVWFALAAAGVMVGWTWSAPDGPAWELALIGVALGLWMAGFTKNIRMSIDLRQARDELARNAVIAERERIGRDLHDILGHSLTAIAVKASLARQLVQADPARAHSEIVDVERLARSALSDVRSTAAGIRELSLAGELAVARSVLTAAGITAVFPSAIDDVDPAGRQLFGYVLREAVTNVVRHSGAATCTVRLGVDHIEILDDGGGGGPAGDGSGLRGLAERVEQAGGTLTVGALVPCGFCVRATLGSELGSTG